MLTATLTIDQALQQGTAHHQAGQLQDAERLYRAILKAQPNHPDANHNLGVLAVQAKQPAAGLPHLKAALEANPKQGQYWLSYIDALIQTCQIVAARQVLEQGRQRGLQREAVEALADRINQLEKTATDQTAELKSAIAHREAGRHKESALVLQSWLVGNPQDATAYALLAQVLSLDKQDEPAWVALNTALTINPALPIVQRNHARLLLKQQKLDKALQAAQAAYQSDATDPENQLVLAAALGANKQNELAFQLLANALQTRPNYAEAFASRALLKLRGGDPVGALVDAEKSLSIKPHLWQLWGMVGLLRHQFKNLPGAIDALEKALDYEPDNVGHLVNLGEFKRQAGAVEAAIVLLEKATTIAPDNASAWVNLGTAFQESQRIPEAQAAYAKALEIAPGQAEVASNLGVLAKEEGDWEEALRYFNQALVYQPTRVAILTNKAAALNALDRYNEAEQAALQAIEVEPAHAEAHSILGSTLKDLGRLDEAEASFRRALQIKPEYEKAYENLLFLLNYHPEKTREDIFAAYRQYDILFGLPCRREWQAHSNSRESQRQLKVGYVSPDFRRHSARYFIEPLLAHHDKAKVEVYAYAEVMRADDVSERLKMHVDCWCRTVGMSDEALAQLVRADGIDILVDLAGHTKGNRLQVFARKPAPVSVSWLGFGYTTGLTAVDYFLADGTIAPEGCEGLFSETPWRLLTPGYAYRPAEGMGEVNPLPAAARGSVTFGTLTRAVRINHRTIRVWSEILKRVTGSRLVIDSGSFLDPIVQEALAEKFATHGIGRERLNIGCHSPPWDVLRGMDIGLDCFPHNSGTTLFETLYMGVPFVTLAGRPSVGLLGSSVLKGVGHPEWIARTEEDYIEVAEALATDLPRLADLRAGLRREMELSPLMDEAGFARKVEAAYREMWVKWCEGKR